jgi:glutathione-specific gamma-glutamylcyclotransferase
MDAGIAKHGKQNPHLAGNLDWVRGDEDRERTRAETRSQQSGDLWIFAYGSLMWDPGFNFSDVRRAYVADYARAFILLENRGAVERKRCPA